MPDSSWLQIILPQLFYHKKNASRLSPERVLFCLPALFVCGLRIFQDADSQEPGAGVDGQGRRDLL